MNCGACGNACRLPNAVPICSDAICRVGTCNPSFADCDGAAPNGCESDSRSDLRNCGGCGTVCRVLNATAECRMGSCDYRGVCNVGFGDCGTDGANCGMCGIICGEGLRCVGGLCRP
jgi:hypothetical protein